MFIPEPGVNRLLIKVSAHRLILKICANQWNL